MKELKKEDIKQEVFDLCCWRAYGSFTREFRLTGLRKENSNTER